MGEFFEMGGYAAFVWPAYGLSAGVLVLIAWLSIKDLKQTQSTFDKLSGEQEKSKNESIS
ncbi:MAG: heme exporter protein CcmD [Rhodospirillaceae bacterium]|nr:heme exporter protein CcmD [Rhodospirillaceae bacterium]